MITKEELEKIVESALEDPKLFIVEITIGTPPQPKLAVMLDGEEGVTIDQCAMISRRIATTLEEDESIDSAYRLEVSSPGVDQPLRSAKQFAKHVGRNIILTKKDATLVEGKFISFDDQNLTLEHFKEVHKGKFKSVGTSQVPVADMDFLQIKVTF